MMRIGALACAEVYALAMARVVWGAGAHTRLARDVCRCEQCRTCGCTPLLLARAVAQVAQPRRRRCV